MYEEVRNCTLFVHSNIYIYIKSQEKYEKKRTDLCAFFSLVRFLCVKKTERDFSRSV